jgi:hypothetical protein
VCITIWYVTLASFYVESQFTFTCDYTVNCRIKSQLEVTYCFIVPLLGSTCFGHYYAHYQEFATMMLITTLVVSFCKDGRGSVNVKLWFLVVCVRYEVLCLSVVLDNVFLLILIVVILCVCGDRCVLLCVWWSLCSVVCVVIVVFCCVCGDRCVLLCVWWSLCSLVSVLSYFKVVD